MNLKELSTNIFLGEQNIWKTKAKEAISYTENGHDLIRENEKKSFWFAHRFNCLKQVLSNNISGITLDIGGGNGEFSNYLQSIGLDTILLEPGDKGALNAIENGIHNVVNASLKDANFNDSCFHFITLLDVLEHIEDDTSFLQEVFRILKPNGKLVLTVPAYPFLFSDFDKEVGHFRRYTLKKMNNLLKQNGFQIEYKTYFFSLLPIPIFVRRNVINKFRKKKTRKSTGHINKYGIVGLVLRILLWPEKFLIENKIQIPFGSSCLFIVRKLKN